MQSNKPLPESSASKDGATKSSLGDASMGDLNKGYHEHQQSSQSDMRTTRALIGGFVGRPAGWER